MSLAIKKVSGGIWEHYDNGKLFILSDWYVKADVPYFQIQEVGGSQRKQYLVTDITVYNIGGSAETFANFTALMTRLKSLGYPAFSDDGGGGGGSGTNIHNELIERDASDSHPISAITGLQTILDEILYKAPIISSFNALPNDLEIGAVVTGISMSWALNKTFTSLSINNGVGAIPPASLNYTHNPISITNNVTYTITGSDGVNTVSASKVINFRPKRWWGTNASNNISGSDILDLQNSELATNRQQIRTINGGGNYIYFAFPAIFGTPTFLVNGLPNTAFTLKTVSHTNALGHTQNYIIARTNTVQFGTLTIQLL